MLMFAAGPALGADIPARPMVTKAPPVVAPAPTWNGCYIGAHAGGSWTDWHDSGLPHATAAAGNPIADPGDPIVFGYSGDFSSSGFAGGVQGGCDRQYGQWVWGSVTDFTWTDRSATSAPFQIVPVSPTTLSNAETLEVRLKHFGTVRSRIGWVGGNWMLYGTGGLAWAKAEASIRGSSFSPATGTVSFAGSDEAYHLGWTAGVGLEWMFMAGWSLGVEYLHLDFHDADYRFGNIGSNVTVNQALAQGPRIDLTTDVVKAVLNWRILP
jgi:outer membrane immunogenic protein